MVKQFNDSHNLRTWKPGAGAIENRVPYIVDHKLTTSSKGTDKTPTGTITGIIFILMKAFYLQRLIFICS